MLNFYVLLPTFLRCLPPRNHDQLKALGRLTQRSEGSEVATTATSGHFRY